MSKPTYLLLGVFGLAVALGVAALQTAPGYMDAEYYYAGGLRLAGGYGFNEMLLWNYLDDPAGLPHPSHAYWMPLTSMLAALGMMVTGRQDFASARLGFLALAAIIPCLTAALSFSLTRRRDLAVLAGWLAVFSAFYLSYMATTDAFGIYMLAGSVFFLLFQYRQGEAVRPAVDVLKACGFGALAGCMHLARADGVLWLALALWVAVGGQLPPHPGVAWRFRFLCAGFCLLGYLVVMGPWLLRNLSIFGVALSPGGGQALWFTNYDELFIYPASLLTPARWWSSGLGNILQDRLWALGQNLQTAVGVQGEIFLAPLILAGGWRLRSNLSVRTGGLAWLLTFVVMTLAFPYAGARGGFFHSGAALQPLLWTLAPAGLDQFVAWGGRLRGWNTAQARRAFQVGVVCIAVFISGLMVFTRVVGSSLEQPAWGRGDARYIRLEQALVNLDAQPGDAVLVNDAPGYFVASRRPAFSIPYGDVETLLAVAERYQARYLVLEINQLQGEDDLYAHPGDRPGLRYLDTLDGTHIFLFVDR